MTFTMGAMFLGGMAAGVLSMAAILWWFRGREPSEAQLVCWDAYQVVGSMLSDLGQFGTERGDKILDNLAAARLVHDDVLPWRSLRPAEPDAPVHIDIPRMEKALAGPSVQVPPGMSAEEKRAFINGAAAAFAAMEEQKT